MKQRAAKTVVMLGPSPAARGGMASVIGTLLEHGYCDGGRCRFIATHVDGGALRKAARAGTGSLAQGAAIDMGGDETAASAIAVAVLEQGADHARHAAARRGGRPQHDDGLRGALFHCASPRKIAS